MQEAVHLVRPTLMIPVDQLVQVYSAEIMGGGCCITDMNTIHL